MKTPTRSIAVRSLALVLAAIMLLSLLPVAALAETIQQTITTPTDLQPNPDSRPIGDESSKPPAIATDGEATETVETAPMVSPEPSPEPTGEPASTEEPVTLLSILMETGYAYLQMRGNVFLYRDAAMQQDQLLCTVQEGDLLLCTDATKEAAYVSFMDDDGQLVQGYAAQSAIENCLLSEDDAFTQRQHIPFTELSANGKMLTVYLVKAIYPEKDTQDEQPPTSTPQPLEDLPPLSEEETTQVLLPNDELEATLLPTIAPDSTPSNPDMKTEDAVAPGDYRLVTSSTRVYCAVDDSEDGWGETFEGFFTRDAVVQVEAVTQDGMGRNWCKMRYLYGADDADGNLLWTAQGTVYVLTDESLPTDAAALTATDYALSPLNGSAMYAAAASDIRLKSILGGMGSFSAGQTNMEAVSGHDSEYAQIAKIEGYGTIYATPHYMNGYTVYCLEHTMDSPGTSHSASGPYTIYDLAGYLRTPGYSGAIYHAQTMHAIAWVVRHTYPFMVLDRSDSDNNTWSRVAGQFAIREVVKQLEGTQYVRDYWDMDAMYRASGQAPAEYLEYARWLARNALSYARQTGTMTVSNLSTRIEKGITIGTVTLTTDADHIRISRSCGNLTGNTGGADSNYYYLHSGDTVQITSSATHFSIVAESMPSSDEEANFLIGVPDADIQKIVIPMAGDPYPYEAATITFDVPNGSVEVIKTDADTGTPLAGASFELRDAEGNLVAAQTTASNGKTVFDNIPAGSYSVVETGAPQGFQMSSSDVQTVTVTAGQTSQASFINQPITGSIRIIKKDSLSGDMLAGAVFSITRVSSAPALNGADVGEVLATLTTDENGIATSPALPWGIYRVEEMQAPAHYVSSGFSQEVAVTEHGKTYVVNVANEPAKGYLQLTKTDALDGCPIEGVTFDIYQGDVLVSSMVTDASGTATSEPLTRGTYTVREHDAPAGYIAALATIDCVIRSDETTEIAAQNQPIQGRIQIHKTDELTGDALAGAAFTITRLSGLPSHDGSKDGEVVAVIDTDANGEALSPLLTWGTYQVEETGVPEHFVDRHFSTEVVISEQNQTISVDVQNEPTKGWIRLIKTDRLNGNPIAGVAFDIYQDERLISTMMTDENGIALSDPLPKGRYLVREQGMTPGYFFEKISLPCTVQSDEITDLRATNQPVQVQLTIDKRDAEEEGSVPQAQREASISEPAVRGDGQLTGAVFQVRAGKDICDRQGHVLYLKGEVVIQRLETSGEDASVTTDLLWPGVYEVIELEAPIGYTPTKKTVTLDARDAAKQSEKEVIIYSGVIKNTIRYGKYAFVKFLGDNEIHTDAGLIETPEKGAEFEIYLKSAGSYANARAFERDLLTTNKHGYAETKKLPYGVYTVRQVKGTEGYAIKAPFDIFITGTEDLNHPPILTINNEAIRYRLKFVKTDAETGKTITAAGTGFQLRDAAGMLVTQTMHYPTEQVIDTFYTDEHGEVTLPETVLYGQYEVVEIKAPTGYLLPAESLPIFVGDSSMLEPGEDYLLTYEIKDVPVKGRIVLDKYGLQLTGFEPHQDEAGNTFYQPIYENSFLAGAAFAIYAAEDIIGADGTAWYQQDELVETITTTSQGKDASSLLPLGRYYVVETSASRGYVPDNTRYDIELTDVGNQTPVVEVQLTVENAFMPIAISLQKQKETMKVTATDKTIIQQVEVVPAQGVCFGLFNAEDIPFADSTLYAGTLLATAQTDTTGKLCFSGYYPHGRYEIQELETPVGYQTNGTVYSLELLPEQADDDHIIRASLSEPVLNQLIYHSVTLTKTDITGENTLPCALIEVTNEAGEVVYRAYTDENGEIPDIPVMPGNYTFREVLAPEGYALNEATLRFTVDAEGNIIGDTAIRDDFVRFFLEKQDEHGNPLTGVTFALIDTEGHTIRTAVSDENGKVCFEQIPHGSYTVQEVKPLPGYLKDWHQVSVEVSGSWVNRAEPIATIANHPIEFSIKKVDANGKPLKGARFGIWNDAGQQVMTATSDDEGIATFSHVPYGTYTLQEIAAPDGYLLNRQPISIHIDDDWMNPNEPLATLTNQRKRIMYLKVDTSGQPMPGIVFCLIRADTGETVETVVSDKDGVFLFTQFDYGDWIIREADAPGGYLRMEDIHLHVDDSWTTPEPVLCVNISNHYEFQKTDASGMPLEGVKFVLEDASGTVLERMTSDSDGMVYLTNLKKGTYFIKETETLEGYTLSGEVIKVVIDESYVVPDKPYRMVNYTIIQTGVRFAVTATMWIGLALILGSGTALLMKKRKTRREG